MDFVEIGKEGAITQREMTS